MRSDLRNRTTVNATSCATSAEALENVLDLGSPCCASDASINKSESPKLSLEPQQMKRKKKGGGYNLRKSLAWDRAFFTEEGVLDPLELSVFSGASCREGSPFINEDTSGGSPLPIKPADLQKHEINIVREPHDADLGKETKKDLSSRKLDSSSSNFMASTSLTSQRVPTRGGSKSGSRCGDCSRPLPLSSLKRPANVHVGKVTGKEMKLPKVPGLKRAVSSIGVTTRSTILREHNQITLPDFNIQRNAGSNSSSKSIKNTQNASKASSLRSAHYADGNSGNLSFKRHSSINMSPVLFEKANNSGSDMISCQTTPDRPLNSSDRRHESATYATRCTQNAYVSGSTIPSQNQMMKPSGLRMPSPSLSFFSQPKPSVFRDLSLRDTGRDVCGSQKPGNLMLQDNLRRTPKIDNIFPESIVSSSKVISSRSKFMASFHVSAVELIKPDLEQNPMQKVQDLPENSRIGRISHEEAKMQKIDIEVSSQGGRCEQVMDDTFVKQAIDGYPVKSESCGSGWRNPESRSEQNYESETVPEIDEPPQEKNTCNSWVLNHGAIRGTRCEDSFDHKVQDSLTMLTDWEESCKPDGHEPQREQTVPVKYSLDEAHQISDEDKNVLKTKEIASEQLDVSKQNGSASVEALVHWPAMAENTYSGCEHLHADIPKEAACLEVLTDNLLEGESHVQNTIFASTIGGCENKTNVISEVDNTKQSGKGLVVRNISLKVEVESQRNVELNTTERLFPEKQICLQTTHQAENVEKLLSVVPHRKDGNEVIDTKMASSLSPGKMHDCNFDKDKMTRQHRIITEFDSVDNSVSSDSHNYLIRTSSDHCGKQKCKANVLLNGPANQNLSNNLHQDIQGTEIDFSSFPESRTREMSQNNTLGKVTEMGAFIQEGSANNSFTATMSIKEGESDMDNFRNKRNSGTLLVQSPEGNIFNKCCSDHSEHVALPSDEFLAEHLVQIDDIMPAENYLQTKSTAEVSYEDNALGSIEDSVTGQNKIYISILKSSSASAKESPMKHESCNDEYGNGGHEVDTITNPFSETSKSEIFEEIISSSCLHHQLDPAKVEAALAPNNIHGDGLNEKNHSFVLPQNAVPFSDEWLAAIEAAGEDILTRKSGAVQNSPRDKSLPEPSPWSPVRRKNNPIGPFDCTKFTNIDPSDSN